MKVCPECGSTKFATTGIQYNSWVVDGNGHIVEDLGCYEAKLGESAWYCCGCDAEFEGPHELKEV